MFSGSSISKRQWAIICIGESVCKVNCVSSGIVIRNRADIKTVAYSNRARAIKVDPGFSRTIDTKVAGAAAGVLDVVDFEGAHYDAKKRTEMFTGSTSVVLAAQTILQAVVVLVSIELPLPDLASRDTTMPV